MDAIAAYVTQFVTHTAVVIGVLVELVGISAIVAVVGSSVLVVYGTVTVAVIVDAARYLCSKCLLKPRTMMVMLMVVMMVLICKLCTRI